MPVIVADSDEIGGLAIQLQLAANFAGEAAAAVHAGLGLGELEFAALLDPTGAARFDVAVYDVLTGPFGLAGIEADLGLYGARLQRAAENYLSADRDVQNLEDAFAATARRWDGRPRVVEVDHAGLAISPPRNTVDLITNLAELNDGRPGGLGEIDIQTLTGIDSSGRAVRQVIVYLPGTDTLNPIPGTDVDDPTTDDLALRGQRTTYENGVLAAMRAAGVQVTDDVTLVGHSLGGMIAVNTARDAFRSGEFNVTHVITAGSPIGVTARALPASTQLLAIENKADVIPDLDGASNPQRPNITTVEINHENGSIGANHGLTESYLAGAAEVDGSCDPKVQAFLAGQVDLSRVDQATMQRYSITRQ